MIFVDETWAKTNMTPIRGWAPRGVVEGLASTSAFTHYESMMRGVIDLRDLVYFASVIAAFLVLDAFAIDWKKSD